jgi:hypothetical protein
MVLHLVEIIEPIKPTCGNAVSAAACHRGLQNYWVANLSDAIETIRK